MDAKKGCIFCFEQFHLPRNFTIFGYCFEASNIRSLKRWAWLPPFSPQTLVEYNFKYHYHGFIGVYDSFFDFAISSHSLINFVERLLSGRKCYCSAQSKSQTRLIQKYTRGLCCSYRGPDVACREHRRLQKNMSYLMSLSQLVWSIVAFHICRIC